MTELFLLILAFSVAGVVYGFYDLVHGWLKPRVERLTPKIKKLIPDLKPILKKVRHRLANPKPKRKRRSIAPYDIIDDAHARYARHEAKAKAVIDKYRSPLSSQMMSRPRSWRNLSVEQRRTVERNTQREMERLGVESAVADQVKRELHQIENDKFWNQIAQECQRITGSVDFKSCDRDLGKKSENKG